mmetsp:Transcript_29521/g.48715  ORF Transcript_29521/g.48715 Transcript_29521/m.48715 type:complete len:167 (+) Transcript_29521:2-502(+)
MTSIPALWRPQAANVSLTMLRRIVNSPTVTRSTTSALLRNMSSTSKPGVVDSVTLKDFIAKAGSNLLVVDVRNPNSEEEPGDQKSIAVGPLPTIDGRPQSQLLTFDRSTKSMPLPEVSKETPIITHCGGGGRGQKAKVFLEENGFTNVVNGGGPKETANWDIFGTK